MERKIKEVDQDHSTTLMLIGNLYCAKERENTGR